MQQEPGSPNPGEVRKAPLVVGVGITAILIVIAGYLVLDVLRVYRDFSEQPDTFAARAQVEALTYEFAVALWEGDAETAYRMLGEATRERHTPETLRAEIDEYEEQLRWSRPFPVKGWRAQDGESGEGEEFVFFDPEDSDWRALTYFRAPDSEEEFTLITALSVRDDGFGYRASIDEWQWVTKTDDLQSPPIVDSVKSFAQLVLDGDWESVGPYIHSHSRLVQGGYQLGVPRLKESLPPLPEEASVHVRGVRPKEVDLMAVEIELRGAGEIQELTVTTRPTDRGLMEVLVGERRDE